MAGQPKQLATQQTRPREGDPIEISIPTKRDVLCDLAKTARPTRKPKLRRARQKRTK